jgi:C1A family cysteine protease
MTILLSNNQPSPPDSRDHRYRSRSNPLSDRVDLRDWGGLVEDQGDLGSCTGSALTDAYETTVKIQYPEQWAELSRLFVYYNSRIFYSGIDRDGGSYLRDTLKAVRKYGVCREDIWPYDITRFRDQPTARAYVDAQYRTITNYEVLYDNQEIMEVLNFGRPVLIGMTIFPGFMVLNQGDPVVDMPDTDERPIGTHAMCLLGYDRSLRRFLAKNGFGVDWGDSGYCWIPFDYMDRYCFDRWCFDISDQDSMLLG